MSGMIGRALRLVVAHGLLVGFCICAPLAARIHSSAPKPPQNQTEVPDVEAVRLAAEQGDAAAQINLGVMYAEGRGVPQDDAEAVRWFRLAAEQRDAEAQFNLGVMYYAGRGVPQDDAEAVRWYRLAASRGFTDAQFNLGLNYADGLGVPQDWVAAYMWLSLTAAQASAAVRDTIVWMRDSLTANMTAEQIAKARRLAREWQPTQQSR